MRLLNVALERYVVELSVVPLPNPLTVDRFTTYFVTPVGLLLDNQLTVTEV